MSVLSTKNTVLLVGGVVAVAAAVYFGRAAIQKISQAGSDAADAVMDVVNPVKIITNAGASLADIYTGLADNNTSFGADVQQYWNIPANVTNEQVRDMPLGAGASMEVYQWLTGSKGNQVSDFNEWWDGIWK